MDHIKKLVYIIVGCLTIISLVFTLCHKVGHCASSSVLNEYYNYQLPYYSYGGKGYFLGGITTSSSMVNNVAADSISRYAQSGRNYWGQAVHEVYSRDHYQVLVFFGDVNIQSQRNMNIISNLNYDSNNLLRSFSVNSSFIVVYDVNYSNNSFTPLSSYSGGFTVNMNNGLVTSGSNYYVAPFNFKYCMNYPFVFTYNCNLYSGDVFVVSPGTYTNPVSLGHSKGGVLGNYVDSEDILSDYPDLPEVDVTPPSDPNSNPGWFQKILNGLGKVNDSIKGGVLTLGDYLGQIKEDIENAIAWITETPDSDEILDNVEPYLEENDLISGFLSSKTVIQGVYGSIGNVTAKTRSEMVWDIPFNLPSMSQTFHARIDFGWYENIRSTFEPFLNMFLCVTFLFSFLRSIPGILHGNSGEGDT